MKKATFYKKLDDEKVRCTACEWRCVVPEGASGICGVRINDNGDLYSLVYGNVVDAYGDYIEKKKLAHFMPGSMTFSIGTIGCNFACDFCINWQISQASRMIKEKLRKDGNAEKFGTTVAKYGYDLSPEKVIGYCKRRGYKILAYTYNEPTVFIEYALDLAKLGRENGIKSVFVTNGYMSEEAADALAGNMDAISFDLKAFTEKFYQKHCKGKLDPVLRNIEALYKSGVWIEITTLVIPGENDSPSELKKIAQFIVAICPDIPWHITRFTPDYKLLDKSQTPEHVLYRTYEMAKEVGLRYIYFGNLWDSDKTSTYCPNCERRLIFRDVYDARLEKDFDPKGKCRNCGEKIAGVWE